MSAAQVFDSLTWMKGMRIVLYGFDPIQKVMDPALAVSIETDILTASSATGTLLCITSILLFVTEYLFLSCY
jgi:hypothetical protein